MVRFIIDPQKTPARRSSLQVIGAGLPRTATSSLQAAFEELGFDPCLHMAQVIPHPNRQQLLLDAAREKDTVKRRELVHRLVDGYAAVCDMPGMFFLEDLMDMYPDAKVVLSGRPDAETWAQSCYCSLGFFFTSWFWACGLLWRADRLWYRVNMFTLDWGREKLGESDLFSGRFYERYNESVRETARRKGREILEFKAEDGWKPLCAYLRRDVPDTYFPRVNERKTLDGIKAIIMAKGFLSWAALGGAAWLGWNYLSRVLQ